MASQHLRENEGAVPLREGEFQRIPGIGPGIAQRLHAAGIETFRQLASLSPEEISERLSGLVGMTALRIAHQDWPGKAHQLAEQLEETPLSQAVDLTPSEEHWAAEEPPAEPEGSGARQHYASFMVELLQDETYQVRRTRTVHIQSGEKESWAGWDTQRLGEWIARQAAIPEAPEAQTVSVNTAQPPDSSQQESTATLPFLELGTGAIASAEQALAKRFLMAGQPFEVHLPVHLTGIRPALPDLAYRALIRVRPLGGNRIEIGEASGPFDVQEQATVTIPTSGLDEGTYHMEISMLIYPANAVEPEKVGRCALSEGGLLHVFA